MAATKTKARSKKSKPAAKASPKAKASAKAKTAPKATTKATSKTKGAPKPKAAAAKKPPKPAKPRKTRAGAAPIDGEMAAGDVSESAKTGAFARIKAGVGSFFSKITRKKAQPAAGTDDSDEGDPIIEPPAAAPMTLEIVTGDILAEAEDASARGKGRRKHDDDLK